MLNVSFIIPSYNSHLTIQRTLQSILDQSVVECIKDILVVDSSDDQKTRAALDQFKNEKIRLHLLNTKTSPALGRNAGAKLAQGELFCFIDSDVILDKSWLQEIIKAHESGCYLGSGSVSIPDFQSKNFLALAQFYLQCNESLAVGEQRTMPLVPACNMFITRRLFELAGGYPNIRAAEEVILCLTLKEFSKVWFIPQAKCFHVFRESWQSCLANQKLLGKYILIYRRMYYKKWYYQGLWPALFLPGFLLVKLGRIKFRIYRAGWTHFKHYLISSPWFFIGLSYWAGGFLGACFAKEGCENISASSN